MTLTAVGLDASSLDSRSKRAVTFYRKVRDTERSSRSKVKGYNLSSYVVNARKNMLVVLSEIKFIVCFLALH